MRGGGGEEDAGGALLTRNEWEESKIIWSPPKQHKPAAFLLPKQRYESGGKTRNRTEDTRIFSALLYQLSYFANRVRGQSKRRTVVASMGFLVSF